MKFINLVDRGLKAAISNNEYGFALLKVKPITNEHGAATGYRATLAITRDSTRYVKADGEIVTSPNLGEVITVNVNSTRVPEIKGMVTDVKLVNPVVHSVYATSAPDSSFAQINWSVSADNITVATANSGK